MAAEQLRHPDGSAIFRLKDAEPKAVCTTEAPITEPFSISPDERPWNEYYEADEALRLVENGESVFLCGYGGTGKTFAAKEAAQRLL